jgi:Secretion system C-terminal sorting domain
MKKLLRMTLLFACLYNFIFAQQYTQYFDGADTSYSTALIVEIDPDTDNVWQIGPPQKAIFNGPATVPNAMVTDTINFYPQGNTSRFITKVIPWANFGIYALQWQQKLDMANDFAGGIVEYSFDHGGAWFNVFNNPYVYNFYGFLPTSQDTLLSSGEYAFSGTDSTWRDVWLCFDISWLSQFQDTIYFRYTLKSDSVEGHHEGWLIDNMISHITFQHTLKDSLDGKYLNAYPNPANDILYIETQKLQEFHIIEEMTLTNTLGQIVGTWHNIPTKFFVPVDKYPSGNYLLNVRTNIKSETVTVQIQHD